MLCYTSEKKNLLIHLFHNWIQPLVSHDQLVEKSNTYISNNCDEKFHNQRCKFHLPIFIFHHSPHPSILKFMIEIFPCEKENLALDTTLKFSNIHCVSKSTTLAFLMVLSLYMDLIRCEILQFCNEVMNFIIW